MGEVKYSKAFDSKLGKWVDINDFTNDNKADWYDKPRYYSSEDVNDETCEILTYNRGSVKFRRKNMKATTPDIEIGPHFASIGKNLKVYREKLSERSVHLESEVHRTAKKVAEGLQLINLPAVKANVFGTEVEIAPAQAVAVKYIESERFCSDSETRPDLVFEIAYMGDRDSVVKENLHVEILYSHRVEMAKKLRLENAMISCIEVDLSYLKGKNPKEMKKKGLEEEIRDAIVNAGYWISCRYQQYFERNIEKYILELNTRTAFLESKIYAKNKWEQRVYAFKDSLRVPDDHPCKLSSKLSFSRETGRMVEPGMCIHCKRLLYSCGYMDENVDNLEILCDKTGEFEGVPRFAFVSRLKELIDRDYKTEYWEVLM